MNRINGMTHTKSSLILDFWRGGVPPVCFGVLFGGDEREQMDQSPHGPDGHAPFLHDTKSNCKETLVSQGGF
jgi:hypothetical protein